MKESSYVGANEIEPQRDVGKSSEQRLRHMRVSSVWVSSVCFVIEVLFHIWNMRISLGYDAWMLIIIGSLDDGVPSWGGAWHNGFYAWFWCAGLASLQTRTTYYICRWYRRNDELSPPPFDAPASYGQTRFQEQIEQIVDLFSFSLQFQCPTHSGALRLPPKGPRSEWG